MLRRLFLFAPVLPAVLASCVAPPVDATPPRALPVTVAPPPPAPVAPPPVAPGAVEPGIWTYARTASGSAARFGAGGATTIAIECDRAGNAILLRVLRANPSAPDTTAVLRASTTLKSVPVTGGGGAFGTARMAPRDPILDALAFSRGKFGISVDGRERWLPAWPEFTRVLEDCRA